MINKVSEKSIVPIDIEQWIPSESEFLWLDVKEFLFKEMILKEVDFRKAVDEKNWETYRDKYTFVFISNRAIIPQWAWLILAQKLSEVNSICFLKSENPKEQALLYILEHKDYSEYQNKRVLVKGCSKESISQQPYILLTQKLVPIVKALSFGESCSTVPIFKH